MAQTVRFRVEIPDLPRIEEARDFSQLWHNLNNDQLFACEELFLDLTGQPLYVSGAPEDLWPPFEAMVRDMERAVSTLNFILAASTIGQCADRWEAGRRLTDLADGIGKTARAGPSGSLAGVLEHVLTEMQTAFVLQIEDLGARRYGLDYWDKDWPRSVFVLAVEPGTEEPQAAQFDFFISYKHARYFTAAKNLCAALEGRGLRCWLDREQLGIPEGQRIDPLVIKKKLKAALRSARSTIFFETYDVATADEDFRGNRTAFNWQAFERRHARHLVYVHPDRELVNADEIAELAPQDDALEDLQARPGDASLPEAIAQLAALSAKYFDAPVAIAPRAAIALLAPGGVDRYGGQRLTLSSDVLINLLRYSPYCALALAEAGLDLFALFEVGSRFHRSPWRLPGDLLLADSLGHAGVGRAAEVETICAAGHLDETNLLVGLLEHACLGSDALDMLARTRCRMRSTLELAEARELIPAMVDAVKAVLRRDGLSFPEQQWAVVRDAAALRVYPIAPCGVFRVSGLDPAGPVAVRVHATLSGGVFAPSSLADLAALLGARGPAAQVAQFLDAHAELATLLGSASSLSVGSLHEIPLKVESSGPIFLEPVQAADESVAILDGALSECLVQAVNRLMAAGPGEHLHAPADAAPFPIERRQGLVVGQSMRGGANPNQEPWSLLELTARVLAPLWRYQQIRMLDEDSL